MSAVLEFPEMGSAKARREHWSRMIQRADGLEREAEDLRNEADDLEQRARRMRQQAEMESLRDHSADMDADHFSLMERLLEDSSLFVRDVEERQGRHPLLSPLRRVLFALDELMEEVDDRRVIENIRHAMKQLERLLHARETAALKAWKEAA